MGCQADKRVVRFSGDYIVVEENENEYKLMKYDGKYYRTVVKYKCSGDNVVEEKLEAVVQIYVVFARIVVQKLTNKCIRNNSEYGYDYREYTKVSKKSDSLHVGVV